MYSSSSSQLLAGVWQPVDVGDGQKASVGPGGLQQLELSI